MSTRKSQNARLFIPVCHIQYCVNQAIKTIWPELGPTANRVVSNNTTRRLRETLEHLIGLNYKGKITATQAFICGRLGKSTRAFRNDLRDLETLGLISTEQHYDKVGMRCYNTYTLAPIVLLWRKGKRMAADAKDAMLEATEGLTSRLMRRMNGLHKSFRALAQQNLRQGADSLDRNFSAELTVSSSKKELNLDKQSPTATNQKRAASVVELVQLFGFSQAARMLHMTLDSVQSVWNQAQATSK